jgi:hypothetical protein
MKITYGLKKFYNIELWVALFSRSEAINVRLGGRDERDSPEANIVKLFTAVIHSVLQ